MTVRGEGGLTVHRSESWLSVDAMFKSKIQTLAGRGPLTYDGLAFRDSGEALATWEVGPCLVVRGPLVPPPAAALTWAVLRNENMRQPHWDKTIRWDTAGMTAGSTSDDRGGRRAP